VEERAYGHICGSVGASQDSEAFARGGWGVGPRPPTTGPEQIVSAPLATRLDALRFDRIDACPRGSSGVTRESEA
jgi:hypothetical protein